MIDNVVKRFQTYSKELSLFAVCRTVDDDTSIDQTMTPV